MSYSEGTVYQAETPVGFFVYYDVSDIARPGIGTEPCGRWDWSSETGMNWSWQECACASPTETPVRLFADYGRGVSWSSTACLSCMAITGSRSPDDTDCAVCVEVHPEPCAVPLVGHVGAHLSITATSTPPSATGAR